MSFHNVKLPDFIAVCASGGPEFSTSSVITNSGREIRKIDRHEARQKYYIKNCKLSISQFNEFNAFFRARSGQGYSFRFKDFSDYKVISQIVNSTSENPINLCKLYDDSISPYIRRITKPVISSVKIYSGNNLIIPEYIDEIIGKIFINSVPNLNEFWRIEYEFDVEVRFNSDNFIYNYCSDGLIELSNLELIEVNITNN